MSELTAAEREALAPFIWGGWIGVAKGREKEYADGLRAAVGRILTDRLAEQRGQIAAELEAEATRLRHNTLSNRSVLTMRRAARIARGGHG